MLTKVRKPTIVVLAAALLVTSLWGPLAQNVSAAATVTKNSITSNGNGYRISPVVSSQTINPGQSSSVQVYLTNISTAPENLQVVVDDFQAKDETGTPALILSGQSLPRHGLKQYTSLPTTTLSLNPGETKSLFVNIKIPANAVPGGYYGAVRFTPLGSNGEKNVNLAASVGSLMLVKVPGDIKEVVTIASFGVSRGGGSLRSIFFGNSNLAAVVRFQNSGDIQEQPFGKIVLKKGGKTLQTTEINNTQQPGNVLPDSIRKFSVSLDKVGKVGKYTVEGNFGYGSNGQLLSAKSTFYVIPLILVVIVIAAIAALIAAIYFGPKAVRKHDRRILRHTKRKR